MVGRGLGRLDETPVLASLAALDAVLADCAELSDEMRERIAVIRSELDAGRSLTEIVTAQPGPAVVQMLTECAKALESAGAHVRRAQARALYDEGMTMDQIAAHFGVTRQRVSTLLREFRSDRRSAF